MDLLSDNTIPWHLIVAALQDNLGPEEDAAFQQWMAASAQNRELFLQVKDVWNNRLDDFPAYQQANETVAWNALHSKLQEAVRPENGHPATVVAGTRERPGFLLRMVSIAALLVIATGIILWYRAANDSNDYTTGTDEQRSVSLPDGTVIKLFQATSIEIPAAYNQLARKVILKSGKAFFEVQHKEQIPFIIDLGTASIKDMGTSFTVQKTNDSIHVWVTAGQVEFKSETGNQTRLLSAGMHLQLLKGSIDARPVILVDSLAMENQHSLRFMNTPLPAVIHSFKSVYNKQIIIIDTVIAQKQFTGNLSGQSFEAAMNVLCQALNITFIQKNDTCYLKKE